MFSLYHLSTKKASCDGAHLRNKKKKDKTRGQLELFFFHRETRFSPDRNKKQMSGSLTGTTTAVDDFTYSRERPIGGVGHFIFPPDASLSVCSLFSLRVKKKKKRLRKPSYYQHTGDHSNQDPSSYTLQPTCSRNLPEHTFFSVRITLFTPVLRWGGGGLPVTTRVIISYRSDRQCKERAGH